MEIRHQINATAFVILTRNDEVLLLRRTNTSYQNGNYGLPSGHLEKDELPSECALREAKEEVGVNVIDLKPATVVYNRTGGNNYANFFFYSKKWIGEPENMETDKCDHMGWFNLNKLPENLTPEVKLALENYTLGRSYGEI